MTQGPESQWNIENQKLQLEKKKLRVEREKAIWAAIGAIVPILVALGTVVYGIWSLDRNAKYQFEMKAAELALAGTDPDAAKARAAMLIKLYPDLLSKGFKERIDKLDPQDFTKRNVPREALFNAIAQHPDKQKELIQQWNAIFIDNVPVDLSHP